MLFRILAFLMLASAAAAIVALTVGHRRWHHDTMLARERLERLPRPAGPAVYDIAELDGLPAPVVRYFTRTLTPGQRLIRGAVVDQEGTFHMKAGPEGWRSFVAREDFAANPPAFVWDARISMGPGMPVMVRDSYAAGEGSMRAELLALLPLADSRGGRELAAGALQRYLAEAMWLPTALLPSQGVHWSPRDDSSAVATLSDGGVSVSLEFHFDSAGDLRRVYAPSRLRETNGRFVPMPWGAELGTSELREGMRVPAEAEVLWWENGERAPYWRGRASAIRYRYAP